MVLPQIALVRQERQAQEVDRRKELEVCIKEQGAAEQSLLEKHAKALEDYCSQLEASRKTDITSFAAVKLKYPPPLPQPFVGHPARGWEGGGGGGLPCTQTIIPCVDGPHACSILQALEGNFW
jgi:hypothetical protein